MTKYIQIVTISKKYLYIYWCNMKIKIYKRELQPKFSISFFHSYLAYFFFELHIFAILLFAYACLSLFIIDLEFP